VPRSTYGDPLATSIFSELKRTVEQRRRRCRRFLALSRIKSEGDSSVLRESRLYDRAFPHRY
jgi:hypothetical protein